MQGPTSMAEGAFVEGDQAPRNKDTDELDLQQRVPSRLVEEHGDDARRQPVHGELESFPLSAQPFDEAALDEGLMLRELLKKGRLKNPTLTEKGAPLQLLEDRRLSELLEVTQSIALHHQMRGAVLPLSPERESHDATRKPAVVVSDSAEMSHLEENARSILGGADGSASSLPADRITADKNVSPSPDIAQSMLAFSPSQVGTGSVESHLTASTLEGSCQLRACDKVCREPSKLTQSATDVSSGVAATEVTPTSQSREPLPSASLPEPIDASSEETSDDHILEMPVLELLDKSDLVELSSYIRRARRRRCYGIDVGSCGSESERSLVKMDFSTLPTEASEMVTERRFGYEACNEPTRADTSTTSTSSWYSLDAPSVASRQSPGLRAATSESVGSWTAPRQGLSTSKGMTRERPKVSSLIRFFESKN